jgi:protein TonB
MPPAAGTGPARLAVGFGTKLRRPGTAAMRGGLAGSLALHGLVAAAMLAGSLLHGPAPPPAQRIADVELVMQNTPAVGRGGATAAAAASAARPPLRAPPPAPLGAAPPPRPPAQRTVAAATRGAGDPGTGRVTGDHVIPAKAEDARNAPPAYPAAAAARGEQGLVEMLIHIAPDGRATAVDVTTSSGFADLDAAARTAVLAWHFRPALRDGAPVASVLPFNIHYLLPKPGAAP